MSLKIREYVSCIKAVSSIGWVTEIYKENRWPAAKQSFSHKLVARSPLLSYRSYDVLAVPMS